LVEVKGYRVRFSAAAVAREAGVERTQLYKGDPQIQWAVEAARLEIETVVSERTSQQRKNHSRSSDEVVLSMKQERDAAISRLASLQMSDLIMRMGPAFEDAQSGKIIKP
jgi:hypothetical protein